ncbi:MAG: PqqD family protein [Candidatus Cloacimonetes bacterium]|nr:PqqD family protein [Candidatus Cloacimonadota bacterium]
METSLLQNLAMNDNGFIFDPISGYSYTSNETGLIILKLLASGLDKAEIRAQIMDEYEVSADNFDSDFEHYLLMLDALNLVEY